MEILEYYKKYHKIKNLPIAGCAEMLITTKDNKYVYSYRYGSSNFVSSVFFNILINYLFGYTNIDPKYKNGEYHNLTKEQEKQLKKEYENEYKS
jgi:hypothetical protein